MTLRLVNFAFQAPRPVDSLVQMDAPALLAKIDQCFPVLPTPKMSLRQALLADQSLTRLIKKEECLAAGRIDGSTPWNRLMDQDLIQCRDGIAHLLPESFRYYLGAFLRFSITHVKAECYSPQKDLLGSVIFSITNRSKYNLLRLACLDSCQAEAVAAYLRLVRDDSGPWAQDYYVDLAAKALKRYWEPQIKLRDSKR